MMTNNMIIAIEKEKLVAEGILSYTGRMIVMEDMDGNEVEIPEIQPIHTYQAWKKLGYQVKKGEKAVAKFPVWKYLTKKKKEEDVPENEDGDKAKISGKCYMKMSAFFTDKQVEKIKEGK